MTIITSKAKPSEYTLSPISVAQITKYLSDLGADNIKKIEVYPSVVSTNDYLAQKNYIDNEEITVCIAEQQTQGRGRYGHQWCSPPGVNIYLSILWPVTQWQRNFELLGLLQLVAIANLLNCLNVNEVKLKWPNDICYQDKKLGGILIDKIPSPSGYCLIIGIGLNVAMSKLSTINLATPWTDIVSVQQNWQMSRNELAAQLIFTMTKTLDDLVNDKSKNLLQEWEKFDALCNREINFSYQGRRNKAVAKGIDKDGNIIIESNNELIHLHSSKVTEIST